MTKVNKNGSELVRVDQSGVRVEQSGSESVRAGQSGLEHVLAQVLFFASQLPLSPQFTFGIGRLADHHEVIFLLDVFFVILYQWHLVDQLQRFAMRGIIIL